MKTYKVRMECVSFQDIEIEASSKKEARLIAETHRLTCDDMGFEFGEFLD